MSQYHHEWVARLLKHELTDFQKNAVDLLCRCQGCGPYDFPNTWKSAIWNYGNGVRFVIRPMRLSTFDGSGLTALVIGAHELGIRVEIEACNMRHIAIVMHPRVTSNEGDLTRRHPTIEQAVQTYRK